MRRFAKPLYGLTPVPRVRIPPSPPAPTIPSPYARRARGGFTQQVVLWCPTSVRIEFLGKCLPGYSRRGRMRVIHLRRIAIGAGKFLPPESEPGGVGDAGRGRGK